MANIKIKIGDVFKAVIEDKAKFFQYIGFDTTQLNSAVIKVFKTYYSTAENPNIITITGDAVDFYAHCLLSTGVKINCWTKIGNSAIQNSETPLFRDTYDYGRAYWEEPILVSNNWVIWHMNEEMHRVGKLTGKNQTADIGMVMQPKDIMHRMQYGTYGMPFYPTFDT
ncbi:hypothetical protein GCM10023172_26520 [Hymenobacter ginsengisoli]|uniref:Uncharacterized protein n=1 Tax=Hymenobacter ginsengisoli TaxID=1051626 RepID=A0ABP8QIN9_9BACT|nr:MULTISPECIES: hypothetical protein [unclassified Hymenobacter]MBO2030090.1 hypothetical protein [Hymenobacter sp. BT559]